MGIHQHRDKTFYVKCDFEGCMHSEELKAKDFYEALAEAKRLGFYQRKDRTGRWVSFDTRYCEMCYNQPEITVYRTKNLKLKD